MNTNEHNLDTTIVEDAIEAKKLFLEGKTLPNNISNVLLHNKTYMLEILFALFISFKNRPKVKDFFDLIPLALKQDDDFNEKIIFLHPEFYRHLPYTQKIKPAIYNKAIETAVNNLHHLPNVLLQNEQFILSLLHKNLVYYRYISSERQENPVYYGFVMEQLRHLHQQGIKPNYTPHIDLISLIDRLPKQAIKTIDDASMLIKLNGKHVYRRFSRELRKEPQLVEAYLSLPGNIDHTAIPDIVKQEKRWLLAMFDFKSLNLDDVEIPVEFLEDIDVAIAAVKNDPSNYRRFHESIRNNLDVLEIYLASDKSVLERNLRVIQEVYYAINRHLTNLFPTTRLPSHQTASVQLDLAKDALELIKKKILHNDLKAEQAQHQEQHTLQEKIIKPSLKTRI